MLYLRKVKFESILVFANRHSRKILSEIIEVHPEKAIVHVLREVQLSDQLRSPKVRVITPVSIPLESAPWVPELNQFDQVSVLISDLCGLN